MKKITQLMHRLLHGTTPISDVARIRRLGRDEYEYEESGKRTTVQVEMLSGEPSRIIYASTIKSWLPPHNLEPMSPADRNRIAVSIKRHFESRGVTAALKES